MSIRVVIADDHVAVREGLRAVLTSEPGIEVAARCSSGEEAVAAAARLRPDLVLMDLRMPGIGGVRATARITAARYARVLALTGNDTQPDIMAAVEAGAVGYLLKDAPKWRLLASVRAAVSGRAGAAAVAGRQAHPDLGTRPARLTRREAEVLRHVAAGLSNPQIGRVLHISEVTVKTHLVHVFDKLGVHDRTSAVAAALRRAVIPAPRPGGIG